MPKRDWIAAIALGLGVALLVGLGVWRASELQGEYSQDRQEIAANESARVEDSLRICAEVPGFLGAMQCRNEAIATAKGEETAQKDLKAQQHMSVWAWSMFVATLAALLITCAGLVFVVRTWRETKRTADIAREIGEAQVRGFLTIDKATITPEIVEGSGGVVWNLAITVRNSGQSPARRVAAIASGASFDRASHCQTGDIASGRKERIPLKLRTAEQSLQVDDDGCMPLDIQISLIYFDVFRPDRDPHLEVWMYFGCPPLLHGESQIMVPMTTLPAKAKEAEG